MVVRYPLKCCIAICGFFFIGMNVYLIVWRANDISYRFSFEDSIENKLALVSVSIPDRLDDNGWVYVFHIPLTVKAWQRINISTCVIFVYSEDNITSDSRALFSYVVNTSLKMNSKVSFLNVRSSMKIRVSQVIRLYGEKFFPSLKPTQFIVISDSDLWPIRKERYDIPLGKSILMINSDCCGTIQDVKHFPMAHIGMSVSDWDRIFPLDLTDRFSKMPKLFCWKNQFYCDESCLTSFYSKFENMSGKNFWLEATHGGNLWDLDQIHLSLTIGNYRKENGDSEFYFFPHWPCRRVDRSAWETALDSHDCFEDGHVLHGEIWTEAEYIRLELLMTRLYNETILQELKEYQSRFLELKTVKI